MTAPTRRERVRAATIAEIKEAALAQIADEGAAALSIRALARAIGMSAAGLYRYYDGRDALLTELITDAYAELADVVEEATRPSGAPTWERFAAGVRAYRRWALNQPNRFLLIFGTPVPGYAAPEGGPTVAANRRMGEAFFRLAAEAWAAGELTVAETAREPTEGERALAAEIGAVAGGFPAAAVPTLIGAWAHWHGMVILEVTHQLDWLYGEPAEAFVEGEIARMLTMLGAVGPGAPSE